MNVRFHQSAWKTWLPLTAFGTAALLALMMGAGVTYAPHAGGGYGAMDSTQVPAVVTFADARRVIDRRCAACHSVTPSDVSLGRTPGGVAFDTRDQIVAMAARIMERAVVQQTMPPGNKTMITDAERALLSRWLTASVAPRK